MDAEAKLTALKKAYADIILNISKEAAARVMASERRAMRYQHELKVAKEEALRMLVRLKQMMDSKSNEAETASLNQQNKIEELEAQLQEAEDIVKDLREELGQVQDELERVKNVNLQHASEANNTRSREIPVENRIYSYQPQNEFSVPSDTTMPDPSHQNGCRKCYNKIICTCTSYIKNHSLPSIVLRSKEPGLYRNGCTQRIRACERKSVDRELCGDKLKDKNNTGENEEGEDNCMAPVPGANSENKLEKKQLADIRLSIFKSFCQKRKRASRKRKTTTPSVGRKTDLLDELIDVASAGYLEKQIVNEGSTENLAPVETEFAESLSGCDGKLETVNNNVASVGLESTLSDATNGHPCEVIKERVIKYTFQRKRKRQARSGAEVNASPEKEMGTEDKQNGDFHMDRDSSLLTESSRDSRRLAQVARQLISLSEKKWWH